MIAANLVLPDFFIHALEVLVLVYIHAAVPVDRLIDFILTLDREFGDRRIEVGGFEEVEIDELLPKPSQFGEYFVIFRERDPGEIDLQELGILRAVGVRIEDGIYVIEYFLRR